jgi:hypothetical protein
MQLDPGGEERPNPALVRPVKAQQRAVAISARTGPSSESDHHDRTEFSHVLSAWELSGNDQTLRCLGLVSFKRQVWSSIDPSADRYSR